MRATLYLSSLFTLRGLLKSSCDRILLTGHIEVAEYWYYTRGLTVFHKCADYTRIPSEICMKTVIVIVSVGLY